MYETIKVKNYKIFANKLAEKTKCEIEIKLLSKEHIHYQLTKNGIPLGVLCINEGEPSFAPFETLKSAQNNQYINCAYMPMFSDFINVIKVFEEMFVYEPDGAI